MTTDALIFRGLYLAWQTAVDAYNRHPGNDNDGEARTLYRRIGDLEAFAAQRPVETLEGLAFKVLIADDRGDLDNTPSQRALVDEAQAIAARMERGEPGTILRLYHDREALRAAYQVFPAGEGLDHDIDALFLDHCDRLAGAIEALPAVTAADFAAKAMAATVDGGVILDWQDAPLWQEARRLVA